jgi:hypothetical protein
LLSRFKTGFDLQQSKMLHEKTIQAAQSITHQYFSGEGFTGRDVFVSRIILRGYGFVSSPKQLLFERKVFICI